MLFSKSCNYGVRAAILIAIKNKDNGQNFIPIHQLAEELNVSFYFLTKILQTLSKANILKSYKGPNGGVRIAGSSEDVYLVDIIRAFDEEAVFHSCLLGLPSCRDDDPCALHKQWKKSTDNLKKVFEETTLAKLANETIRLMARP